MELLIVIVQHYKRVHGSRNYRCDKCACNFAFERDLRRHLKHGCDVTIKCCICNTQYSSFESLAVHKQRKHKVKSDQSEPNEQDGATSKQLECSKQDDGR